MVGEKDERKEEKEYMGQQLAFTKEEMRGVTSWRGGF
jgi:hypothetical protein